MADTVGLTVTNALLGRGHDVDEPLQASEWISLAAVAVWAEYNDAALIGELSTVLVDVVEELVGKYAPSVEADLKMCVVMANVATEVPHLRGFVQAALPVACADLGTVGGLLASRPEEASVMHIRAIAKLWRHGCLCTDPSVHLEPLFCLAYDVARVGEGEDEGSAAPQAASCGAGMRFEAACLLCDVCGYSEAFKCYILQHVCGGQAGALAWQQAQDAGRVGAVPSSSSGSSSGAAVMHPFGHKSVNIGGMLVSTLRASASDFAPRLVPCATTNANMRRLVAALATAHPLILHGVTGSGKSALVQEVASLMGKQDEIIELHLDDQTDSKTLLGSYVCSDVPGEFVWKPGIVTRAVMSGAWLVIENLDRAPLEVISAIVPLLESRKLPLASRGVGAHIDAHPDFRIIGTRTVEAQFLAREGGPVSSYTGYLPNLRHLTYLFRVVRIDEPTALEVDSILELNFPHILPSVRKCLLETWLAFGSGEAGGAGSRARSGPSSMRSFNLRDVIKAARRIAAFVSFNQVSQFATEAQRLDCFCELVDVRAAAARTAQEFRQGVAGLAGCWEVSAEDVEAHVLHRSPQLTSTKETHTIGRVTISAPKPVPGSKKTRHENGAGRYSYTAHSLKLMERIACAVRMLEPVLLVGETGCGKTTVVQELSRLSGQTLHVQNLSLSTDTTDLLGGFRPVTMRQLFMPSYERFVALFGETFEQSQNADFLQVVSTIFHRQQWAKLLKALGKAILTAHRKLQSEVGAPRAALTRDWDELQATVSRFEANLSRIESGFAFAFRNGLLVDAMERGDWILLDEINLASPETLQAIAGVLDGQRLHLSEKGDAAPVQRHPNFRVFAAMNPPTDIGKKELPASLRTRFTEIYVGDLLDRKDLCSVVSKYSFGIDGLMVGDVVDTYLACRTSAADSLVDGAGQRPLYSLRSLTRTLRAMTDFMGQGMRPPARALYEGFVLNFQCQLGEGSKAFMLTFLQQCFKVKDDKSLQKAPSCPGGKDADRRDWVKMSPFWLKSGPLPLDDWAERTPQGTTRFVLTPTVSGVVRNLAAAVSSGIAPILLQGPTSAGKTSVIEYLAARSGHKCVRINNHEHTDIQEYVGGYMTGPDGRLSFRDGLLVEALRNGYWIILDELNLAPSDVLEALNRLLDDNRELFIPETGEIVTPAPSFALFATQNPPGAYGGRKPLSRAFRNRFIELCVTDIPYPEVEVIITESCGIAPKFSAMLVEVMKRLQLRRAKSALFQGKHGSVTTRDLIKWGRRSPQNAAEVAVEGYMLLAEKLRSDEEKAVIQEILEAVCKVQVAPAADMYAAKSDSLAMVKANVADGTAQIEGVSGVALTSTMLRMWTLVYRAVAHSEPVLLIGETGSGKTTACQLCAAERGQRIRILNCHQSTETADIIGGLRPVRGREAIFAALCECIMEGWALLESDVEASALHPDTDESVVKASMESLGAAATAAAAAAVVEAEAEVGEDDKDGKDEEEGKAVSPAKRARPRGASDPSMPPSLDDVVERARLLWQRYKSLFEWKDGPLLEAMRAGDMFVLDEINLAEDAVIERLNSVLESGREITLAEKGENQSDKIIAHPYFRIIATMNPGGDFGKRELSPALRSRFTELWIPAASSGHDTLLVVRELLHLTNGVDADSVAAVMVDFTCWLQAATLDVTTGKIRISVREVLAWARFVSQMAPVDALATYTALLDGVHMILLDGLGIGVSVSRDVVDALKARSVAHLLELCPDDLREQLSATFVEGSSSPIDVDKGGLGELFGNARFSVSIGPAEASRARGVYAIQAENTRLNVHRVLRALQVRRPILLEGPPGVGKSSLVANLATMSGHTLVRINLSEHSELSDLLGTDLPVDDAGDGGAAAGPKFKWCDGVFLKAIRAGHWVLLDEMNLAPQSVLEGLNACFDHREEIFLPEIGLTVKCPPSFRVFCAQNPMVEGGGRKGLPQSLLTRFSRVFVEPMTENNLLEVANESFYGRLPPQIADNLSRYVTFVHRLQVDVTRSGSFGRQGSPWEFNLRDVFRWCELLKRTHITLALQNGADAHVVLQESAYMLFVSRLRSSEDRAHVERVFLEVFGMPCIADANPPVAFRAALDPDGQLSVDIGLSRLPVCLSPRRALGRSEARMPVGSYHARTLSDLATCVDMGWPALVVGQSGSGKRSCVRQLAKMTGQHLLEMAATSSTDSAELLGSFEQANQYRDVDECLEDMWSAALAMSVVGSRSADVQSANGEEGKLTEVRVVLARLTAQQGAASAVTAREALYLEEGVALVWGMRESMDALQYLVRHDDWLGTHACGRATVHSARSQLVRALRGLDKIEAHMRSVAAGGQGASSFVWRDGVVVQALERGYWLMVDNVNMCSASLLDRLNSVLEPGGSILLTESGDGRVITPHPAFRIFLVMDPSAGDISRAMRNRCVELFVPTQEDRACGDATLATLSAASPDLRSYPQLASTLHALNVFKTTAAPPSFPVAKVFSAICDVFRTARHLGQSEEEAVATARQLCGCALQPAEDDGAEEVEADADSDADASLASQLPSLSALLHARTHFPSADLGPTIAGRLAREQWLQCASDACLMRAPASVQEQCSELAQLRAAVDPDTLSVFLAARGAAARFAAPHVYGGLLAGAAGAGDGADSVVQWGASSEACGQAGIALARHLGLSDVSAWAVGEAVNESLLGRLQSSRWNSANTPSGEQLQALWVLLQLLVMDRWADVWHEGSEDAPGAGVSGGKSSFFRVAGLVAADRLPADSPQRLVLRDVFALFSIVDRFTAGIAGQGAAAVASAVGGPDGVLSPLQDMVRARDMLSRTLRAGTAQDGTPMPWDQILVASRWMKKALVKLQASPVLAAQTSVVLQDMTNLERRLAAHWGGHPLQSKSLLWRDGGRSFLPAQRSDWVLLERLRAIVPQILLSGEAGVDAGRAPSQRSDGFALIKEWLSLYATFFWATTQELGQHARGRKTARVDLEHLVEALERRCTMHEASRQLDERRRYWTSVAAAPEDEAMPAGDNGEALPHNDEDEVEFALSKATVALIRREAAEAGEDSVAALAEAMVLQLFFQLGDATAELVLRPHVTSYRSLTALRGLCRRALNTAMRYSGLSPLWLREVRSLLWCIEAELPDTPPGDVDMAVSIDATALSAFCATCTTVLSYRLDAMLRAASGRLSTVQSRWTSATLDALLKDAKGRPDPGAGSADRAQMAASASALTGAVALVQPNTLRVVLRNVDARLLSPRDKVLCTQKLISFGSAELTVSACPHAGRRLLQLFRNTVVAGSQGADACALVTRPMLLQVLVLDVIQSCRAAVTDPTALTDAVAAARTALREGAPPHTVFSALRQADFTSQCSDEFPGVQSLLQKCLDPVLALLADARSAPDLATSGELWLRVGLMRLHLVLPPTPVDPSAKNIAKADLLEGAATQLGASLLARHYSHAASGGQALTLDEQALLTRQCATRARARILREKSIQRPLDAPPFEGLFLELQEFSRTLGGVDRVLELRSVCGSACAGILSVLGAGAGATVAAASSVNAESLMATLDRVEQQEAGWQHSSAAFRTRLEREYSVYEDVVSSVVSAIENISTGLGLCVAAPCMRARDSFVAQSADGPQEMACAWRSIASYPHCAVLTTGGNGEAPASVAAQAVTTIDELLRFSGHLATKTHRAIQTLNTDAEWGGVIGGGNDGSLPSASAVENVAPSVLLLLALARMEFYVASGITTPSQVEAVFAQLMDKFVEHQLRAEEARRQAAAEEAALFKYKPKVNNFVSDDAAEEEALLKQNFPDHLSEFKGILDAMQGGLGDGADNNGDAVADGEAAAASTTEMSFDDTCSMSMVSAHARMFMLHGSRALADQGVVWRRCASPRGLFAASAQLHTTATSEVLSRASLVAGRALSLSLGGLVESGLDAATRGASLEALGTMARRCLSVQPADAVEASSSWLAGVAATVPVDRDLLYLLDHRAHGAWNPLDFHTDPHMEEVRLAHGPLQALQDRVADLLLNFPGNDVLVLVFKLCARVNGFHLATPLGKMLMALELLLRKAQEWEQFASREFSLHEHTQALARLISRWREVELASWPEMLRCKEILAAQGAVPRWTALARVLTSRATVRSASVEFVSLLTKAGRFDADWPESFRFAAPAWLLVSDAPDAATAAANAAANSKTEPAVSGPEAWAYLTKIFDIVDGFLRGTVVGEFPLRLHMVRMWAIQLLRDTRASTGGRMGRKARLQAQTKEQTANLVFGLWQYYAAFLPHIREFQERLRLPIYDKIRDEVKISKWDVLNTYALLEHSDKVHRKLSRLIGEYQKDALEYPVNAVLRRVLVGGLYSEHGELEAASDVPSDVHIFPPLEHAVATVPKKARKSAKATNGRPGKPAREVGASVAVRDDDCTAEVPITLYPLNAALAKRAKATAKSCEVTLCTLPDDVLAAASKARRVGFFAQRVHSYLRSALTPSEQSNRSARFGSAAATSADDMCGDIFDRIQSLRGEGVPKAIKRRAVGDLLKALKSEGVSTLRADTSPRLRESVAVLCLPAPLPLETATDAAFVADGPRDLCERGEMYYMRNVSELSEFRTQLAAARSPDVTHHDAALMLTLADNLMLQVVRQRCTLRQALGETRAVATSARRLQETVAASMETSAANKSGQDASRHLAPTGGVGLESLLEDLSCKRAAAQAVLCNLAQLETLLGTAVLAANPSYVEVNPAVHTLHSSAGNKLVERVRKLGAIVRDAVVATAAEGGATAVDTGADTLAVLGGGTDHCLFGPSGLRLDAAALGGGGGIRSWAMADDAWGRLERAAASVHGALVGTALELSLAQWVSTDVVGTIVGSVRAWAAASRTPVADTAAAAAADAASSSPVRLLEQCQEDVLIGVQRLRQVASRGAVALQRVASEIAAEFGTAQPKTTTTAAATADGGVEGTDMGGDDVSSALAPATPPDPRLPMVEAMRLGMAAVAAAPIQRISSRLTRAAASGAPDDASPDQWRALANSTLVLVDSLVEARTLLVEDVARSYQASGKLLYVVLRVFRTLAAKGVCSNEEEEVEGDGKGMSFEDDVEGTGMGEGDGKKDVSDQIENEDQLSGLKNEEQKDKDEEKEKQDKEEDKAIEMTQDFAGEMEDISDDDNEDEDQDDGDEREELEREMGECNEEDVVDEKQWDEKEDEVSGEEKMEKDSKTQGEEIEGEMTTKDDDDEDGGKDEKEKEKEKEESKGGPEEDKDKDKPELDAGDDEGPEAGAAGADEDGGEDPQQEPNAGEEEMETPAGMDVREEEEKDEGDAGDDAEGEGEGEGDDGDGEDEEKGEGEGDEGADGPGAEIGDDDNGDDDGEGEGDELPENMQLDGDDDAEGGDDDDDEAGEEGEDPDAMAVEDDDDEGEGPEDKPDDADEGAGAAGVGNMPENEVPEPEEPERGEDDGDMEVDPAAAADDEGLPDAFGVQSNAGQEAVLGADEAEGEGGEMEDDEDEDAPTPTGGSSGDGGQHEDAGDASGADHASGARPEEQNRAGTSKDDVPNPLREQGDVNEKWHRRLNVEMRTDEDAGFEDPADEEAADGSRKDTYEYAGQEEGGTEQVLADADQEEAGTQLPEGGETEREEEENKDKRNGEEDADEEGPAVDVDAEGKEKKSRSRDGPPAPKQTEEDAAATPEGGEDADELDDKDGDDDIMDDADEEVPMDFPEAEDRDAAPTRDGFTSKAATDGTMEVVDDDRGGGDDEADDRLDERAAAALVEAWRDDARVDDGGAARALWAKYRSATDAHSIRLCEQLRLILEPSLATRLRGDYRTGKRINMKKVIGFIASGFRKDKIWLRRTKPAKRDYQVMLMIDDSSSMGQAGPLALASMATIANALTKLEVGEMSVASFADDVRVLHPFGRPFTDDVGADVFQHFKFQANSTRLGASLETCLPLFEQARDSSASSAQSTTLQLCFVISDARIDTDNREDLQALVRRMAEKHILVVLIIIDKNADDKESVFNTQSVSFTPQGIVMRSYMDDFPFQFYLTISDLDRLPDILCDALKQWFEMVRAQLDSC